MVSIQNEIGKKGEALARDHLIDKGYAILACNWRYGKMEIDLIADLNGLLVFVEVKTRTSIAFGMPEEFINQSKINHISRAAAAYMREHNHEWAFRFDVISVILTDGRVERIDHIEDAFFPGLM